ncbi:hypothetical protein TOK_2303 [Pseudonocardia sp. N23]|nr:hypothetical protein TOK_2303 [Pseudonocardia sp. N23]
MTEPRPHTGQRPTAAASTTTKLPWWSPVQYSSRGEPVTRRRAPR